MRRWMTVLVMVLALAAWCAPVWGATVYPLTEQEKADTDADWLVVIKHSDLTLTTDDTAQTLTNIFAVAAKQGVELKALVLKTAFSWSSSNAYNDVTVTVGDGDDADLYLDSTQINGNGTEVWLKYGRTGWDGAETTAFVTGGVSSTSSFVTGGVATTSAFVTGGVATTSAFVTGGVETTSAFVTGGVETTSAFVTGGVETVYSLVCVTGLTYETAVFNTTNIVTSITPVWHTQSVMTAYTPGTADAMTAYTPGTADAMTAYTPGTADAMTAYTPGTASAMSAYTPGTANGLNATVVGRKLYTSADFVDFTFTPMADYSLADLDAGEIWFYLKVWDATD